MTEYPKYATETNIVLPYLLPVDYVQFISACKYLHQRYRGQVPCKQQESLVKFFDKLRDHYYSEEDDLSHNREFEMFTRGYKLPNGKLEGPYERFCIYDADYVEFERSFYVDGTLQEKNKYVTSADQIESVIARFEDWKDIDITDRTISDTESC